MSRAGSSSPVAPPEADEVTALEPAVRERAGRLLELAVSDFALIERLRIRLEPGLNVLTGETGAGKSLVIDALGLVLGQRADATMVRHGAEAARVEALFDRLPEPLICIREVAAAGRSSARIDDMSVTAARLAEVAGPLVEIHGQHEQQRLLDERWQRELLDAYGRHGPQRAAMRAAADAWQANETALAELGVDPREVARRLEVLDYEADEIASANLRPGEADEITALLRAAEHAEAIARGTAELLDLLAGDDGAGARSLRELIAGAGRRMAELAALDRRFADLEGRLLGLAEEVADSARELRVLADTVDHDPAELARLEERLGRIVTLERRYGDDEASVIAHGERAAAEAVRLRSLEEERVRRRADRATLLARVADAADDLGRARRVGALRLSDAVTEVAHEVGMRSVRFEALVGRRPAGPDEAAVEIDGDAVAFDATGADEVVFLIAPNPGEPARPLARIASGGELSRIALALKEVLAAADRTPTLVFDEIDAGIGSRSAEPVARSLWRLARNHVVLCVTHLPQIAAHADAHHRIAKHERTGRTVTEITRLEGDARLAELAEMIGGPAGGPAAREGASEMLTRAAAWQVGRPETG